MAASHRPRLADSLASSDSGPRNIQERVARLLLGQLAEFGSELAFQRFADQATSDGLKRSWARLVSASENVAIPLRLGEFFGPMSNSVNSWAWATGDPRIALSLVADYWSVVSNVTRCELVETAGQVGIRYSALYGMHPPPEDVQYRFSSWLTMLRSMTSPFLHPTRVSFTFRKPIHEAEFHRVFAGPIAWNRPANELWFEARNLVRPPGWTPRLQAPEADFWEYPAMHPAEEHRSMIGQLEAIVERSLAQGEFGIKFTAPHLSMSERTVTRRLREEGTTYREVVDRVRRTKAVQMLRDARLSLKQVAVELGYSNPQNFARAFQRWFGMSPQQGRRRFAAQTRPVDLHKISLSTP
jgi:AraC-like DNA-binding protein